MQRFAQRCLNSVRTRGFGGFVAKAWQKAFPFSALNMQSRQRAHILGMLQQQATADGCIEKEIQGSRMRLDVTSGSLRQIEVDLAVQGIREAESTLKYIEFLRKLKSRWVGTDVLILDVGANIGYYALMAAVELKNRARIVALEPDPDNVERLHYNIGLNDYTSIEVLAAAAGAEEGVGSLARQGSSNLHKMSELTAGATDVAIVPLIDIDSIVEQRQSDCKDPVIVRMDIEGYEAHALRGMQRLIASDRQIFLFMEMHREANDGLKSILCDLIANGFILQFDPSAPAERDIRNYEIPLPPSKQVVTHIFCSKNIPALS